MTSKDAGVGGPLTHQTLRNDGVLNSRSHQTVGRELFTSDLTERPRGTWSLFHLTGAILIHMLEHKKCHSGGAILERGTMCFRTFHLFN